MPNRPTTIIEELVAAARGVVAIVLGDRRAASYFDFSRRGLAGSFVAFLLALAVDAYIPSSVAGEQYPSTFAARALVGVLLHVGRIALGAFALRQFNRLDGLVPYLVGSNWAIFFITAVSALMGFLGLTNDLVLIVVLVVIFTLFVNLSRLIVTLSAWQVAIFIAAQFVGMLIAATIALMIVPLPPDIQAAILNGQ